MSIITRIQSSSLFQTALRILQFLSATISLGLFSARLAKIVRLSRSSASNGAVEGILAAAVAYTLSVMLLKLCTKGQGASRLRWVLLVLDILFVGAFIAVAVLTRPKGGSSGPCKKTFYQPFIPKGLNCNLPLGTFVTAIFSTVLHAITAAFHEVKDRHRDQKMDRLHSQQQPEVEHKGVPSGQYSNNAVYQSVNRDVNGMSR